MKIKLFVLDLDGCLSEPFKTPDWRTITGIRDLNRKSRESDLIPPLTICTGRPFPYAEAVAQWLDIRLPFVFESAGMYDWQTNRVITGLNGEMDPGLELIREAKQWVSGEILPGRPALMPEFSKMMDAGIVSPDRAEILKIADIVRKKVADDFPGLEVHVTDVSVNILIRGNNKYQGIRLLSKELSVDPGSMAYIGDSEGDIPALRAVGFPYAPGNAIEQVKEISQVIPRETTRAVLKGYEMIIETNRATDVNGE